MLKNHKETFSKRINKQLKIFSYNWYSYNWYTQRKRY